MKNSSDFKTDLEYGEFAEQIFDGYFRNGSFEFKRDRHMHETGRVFIEYRSRGEKSGIALDDVKPVWLYLTDDTSFGFVMDSSRLIEALRIFRSECQQGFHKPPAAIDKRGGDNDTSVGALIPVHDLVRIMLSLSKPTNA